MKHTEKTQRKCLKKTTLRKISLKKHQVEIIPNDKATDRYGTQKQIKKKG